MQVQELYDRIKRKVENSQIQQAASDAVDLHLSRVGYENERSNTSFKDTDRGSLQELSFPDPNQPGDLVCSVRNSIPCSNDQQPGDLGRFSRPMMPSRSKCSNSNEQSTDAYNSRSDEPNADRKPYASTPKPPVITRQAGNTYDVRIQLQYQETTTRRGESRLHRLPCKYVQHRPCTRTQGWPAGWYPWLGGFNTQRAVDLESHSDFSLSLFHVVKHGELDMPCCLCWLFAWNVQEFRPPLFRWTCTYKALQDMTEVSFDRSIAVQRSLKHFRDSRSQSPISLGI